MMEQSDYKEKKSSMPAGLEGKPDARPRAAAELNDDPGGMDPKTQVDEIHFGEIKKGGAGRSALDLDFILDIPLTITAELGRSRMLIGELLQLGQGSVVELTKDAGEPVDVYVNQRLIARGEVVVVNEKFGIRLTDIVSPAERILKLK